MGVLLRERGWDREREGVGFFSWGSSITGWGQKRNTKDSEPIISVPIAPSLNPHTLSRTHSDVCWFVATFPGSANLLSEATPKITRTEARSVLSDCVYTCVFKTQSYAIKQNITSFFLSHTLSHTHRGQLAQQGHMKLTFPVLVNFCLFVVVVTSGPWMNTLCLNKYQRHIFLWFVRCFCDTHTYVFNKFTTHFNL